MFTWNTVKETIESIKPASGGKVSNRRYLFELVALAERIGLDPKKATNASRANLSTMINQARRATKARDYTRLQELFDMAGDMNNKDLRIALNIPTREKIVFSEYKTTYEDMVEIRMTKDQFERIRRATKLQHFFEQACA